MYCSLSAGYALTLFLRRASGCEYIRRFQSLPTECTVAPWQSNGTFTLFRKLQCLGIVNSNPKDC